MRVVSGIQPTGDLHLGNLLGAILRWERMQHDAPCLFFLADLHSLSEAITALQALGYKPAEAERMARKAASDGDEAAVIIRKALQSALR